MSSPTTPIYTRVRDKTQLLCQLPHCTSWRDSHFLTWPSFVQETWYFIPNSPINHSVVRIFIVLVMGFLSPDDVSLH